MAQKHTPTARHYRGVSPDERRATRRESFIQAGKEVFGAHGFHAATVRQICAAAGLTERYFYESFENQRALFGAVYDQELTRLRTVILRAITSAPRNVDSMADAAMRAYFGLLKAEPLVARILLIEVYGTTQDMDRLYRRGVADFAELIQGIIDTQFRLPRGSPLSSSLLATAVVGAAIYLAMRWYLGGYREPLETMVANALAIMSAVAARLTST